MKYVSTRGSAPELGFDEVLLAGMASDGGLYVPARWPRFTKSEIRALRGLPYEDVALRVMRPFVGRSIAVADFARLIAESYAGFAHPAVAPLSQLGPGHWLAELFQGPTLAFKDYPMQLLGRLFDHVLSRAGRRATIVGATSGDTGSAAIEAFRDRDAVEIFFLHPAGRVSAVQRRQMTTVLSPNVHNIAIEGTFDDCQDLVKGLFADAQFRQTHHLSAANSINWARIMAQIVYYFSTALALGAPDRRFVFSVPTGNFGNVYAGYAARRMGLPIDRLIIGSNANDILTRFFDSGKMQTAPVTQTLSPSMDIQVSSNFERLLFEHCRRDGRVVAKLMGKFRAAGGFGVSQARWRAMRRIFSGHRLDDKATGAVIAQVHAASGVLLDPHSAIGVAAGRQGHGDPEKVLISLATAHPAKFPDAVERACGVRPALPAGLADLMEREERYDVLPNDGPGLRRFIARRLAGRMAA